jgi:hypothetical protein
VQNDYFVFDLSGISQEITSAQLTLSNPSGLVIGPDPSETINFSDVSTPLNLLEGSGPDPSGIFNDLGTGTSFGTQTVTPGTDPVTTTLNADGINALTAGLGAQFAIGGSLTTISGADQQLIFGLSGSPDDQRQLTLTLAQTADWYKFTLPTGRTAVQLDTSTFADGPGEFVNTLDPHIELYDASNHLIATGSALADGRNETIRATGLTPGATYYVRVTTENNTTGEYVLGVTPLRTPTVTSAVDDAPRGAQDGPDGEFKVPNAPDKGWTHVVVAAGFQGDYTIHAQDASPLKSNFAEWEIRATSANPDLFATWVALPGNATNATYQVFAESPARVNDDAPLLTVVVDQSRGPSDALLFGTTLAQSLGSVHLPNWKPGTMLSVRLLTQGAHGNVVADGVFDPPAGAVIRPDLVPPAPPSLEAQGPVATPRFPRADPAFIVTLETGTMRREAAIDSIVLSAINGMGGGGGALGPRGLPLRPVGARAEFANVPKTMTPRGVEQIVSGSGECWPSRSPRAERGGRSGVTTASRLGRCWGGPRSRCHRSPFLRPGSFRDGRQVILGHGLALQVLRRGSCARRSWHTPAPRVA